MEYGLSRSNDDTDQQVRQACARNVGIISQGHFFVLTIEVLEKSSKTDDATRRGTSWSQAFFGKSGAVQQAQVLRSVGALAFGCCAAYAPRRELLQDSMRKQFVGNFLMALAQRSKHLPALHSVDESSRLFRAWPEGVAR